MKYDVVVIGSGLGGLQCAYILAKKGYHVCVLEKNAQIGGCIQSFKRQGVIFDTGFHHVGSLQKGETLHWILEQFNLMHLPWHQLDSDSCDEICLDGQSYYMANGYEQYAERLSSYFPNQHANIQNYTNFLRKSNESLLHGLQYDLNSVFQQGDLIAQSAYQYMCDTISDTRLRDVLSGASMKLELNAETLPLYIFAQLNGSYIPSTWRLRGGGYQIAESLKKDIESMGGEVRVNAPVTLMEVDEKQIVKIVVGDDEVVEARCIISDIHPSATLRLLPQGAVRKSFRCRINSLDNSFGIFTVNLRLKEGAVPYLNRNLYIHQDAELWNAAQGGIHSALVSFAVPENGEKTTRNIDVLTKMSWGEVAQWLGTKPGRRGVDYEEFKARKSEELINFVSARLPELKGNIETVYSSTPLTYSDYVATENGSAYGIRKDYNQLLYTILLPITPIHNLLLTGQNVNFHGILGVSITSLQTCQMAQKLLEIISN